MNRSRRKEPAPAPYDILIRPALADIRVESQQQVQMIIHHGKPADADRENLREFLDPVFDPLFSVGGAIRKQKRASDAPARAVIPAGHGYIDELFASDGHCATPMCEDWSSIQVNT
jgi:hypothetical protein